MKINEDINFYRNIGLVTVYQGIGNRSMPYNEIVLYRHKYYMTEMQFVLSPDDKMDKKENTEGLYYLKCHYHFKDMKNSLQKVDDCYEEQRMKYVIQCHDLGAFLSCYFSAPSSLIRKRIIFTIHTNFAKKDLRYKWKCVLSILLSKCTVVVSNSAYLAIPLWIRKVKGKFLLPIINGVNIEAIDESQKNRSKEKKNCVIYVARFTKLKNHRFIIEVLKNIEEAELVLVGEGPLSNEMKELVKRYKMSNRVRFTGLLSREEVYKEISKASISVSPSDYEGMPVGVLECLACGTQAILSDIPAHREIQEKVPGVEILPLNHRLWIERITYFINNKEVTRNIINQNRSMVEKYFSVFNMNLEYSRLYNELIS